MTRAHVIRSIATVLAVALAALALPTVVSAHAFLAQSSPQAGERLRTSPRTLVLEFTEAVAPASSAHVAIRNAGGQPVRIGPLVRSADGTTLTAALPPLPNGVYIVTWQVVSADDGHPSAGEFAFAVGSGTVLPTQASSLSAPTNWPEAIAGWLFLLGLALGAGGLASEMLIWGPLARGQSGVARPAPVGSALLARGESGAQPAGAAVAAPSQTWPEKDRSAGTAPAPGLQPGTGETTVLPQAVSALRGDNAQAVPGRTWTLPQAPLRTAMLAALVGASSLFVLFAGSLGGSGTLSGLDPRAWRAALQTPAGVLTLAAVVLVLYALVALLVLRTRSATIVSLMAVTIALALRSHPAATRTWWGMLAIVIHVALAVLWVGMLAHLVLVLWRRHAQVPLEVLHTAVRRYARLALWSVLLVLLTGVGAALAELHTLSQIITTAYGRVLLLKAVLVALALLLALVSRVRGLGRGPAMSVRLVRRLTRVEALTLVAVLGAAAWLSGVAPPYAAPAGAAATSVLLGAPPPVGPALYLAGQAGWLEVYLTASRGQLALDIRAPDDTPAQDVHLSLSARTPTGHDLDLFPRPCGPGCDSMHVTWQRGTTVLHLQVAARGWSGGVLTFAVPWPPLPLNPGLLARTIATMRTQRVILVSEQVTSGPGAAAHHVFRLSGAQFTASEPYGARVPDGRSLPGGDGLAQLVIYLPGSHIWVHLWIDARHRVRREVVVAPAYLIQHTFSYPHG